MSNYHGQQHRQLLCSSRSLRAAAAAFFYVFVACNVLAAITGGLGGLGGGEDPFTDPSEVSSSSSSGRRDAINLALVVTNLTRGDGDDRNARFLSTFLLSMETRSDRCVANCGLCKALNFPEEKGPK